ncbi:hypothetical protein FLL45_09395 [Aliikangiella marina]|uniref:Uncharacterized protein n=1 Tax=Aliikangiella marina TaxID=1712262 RepID=A0A545TD45_9GAMM|nr:hypothetical protein [Aliikangiella marina]TQV75142.1 hypothetical protein FLL45_09395 [Aliikangiella marina]
MLVKKLLITFLITFSSVCCANSVTVGNAQHLPKYVLNELEKIVQESGEEYVEISSKQRSVKKQVEIMLDYYIECTKASAKSKQQGCGIERAKRVYSQDCHGGFELYRADLTRTENIQNMTKGLKAALIKLGDERTCMNHVVIPGMRTALIAVDIKPSSVKNRVRFYEAIKSNPNVVKFYYPHVTGKPKSAVYDDAFHIEFKRQ